MTARLLLAALLPACVSGSPSGTLRFPAVEWGTPGSRQPPDPARGPLFAASSPGPNVLLVIVDDVGVDKVSTYHDLVPGYEPTELPLTPTIDGLAAAGLKFTNAWASPMCAPTRASLLTGQHAFRHGVGNVEEEIELDPAVLALPEALAGDLDGDGDSDQDLFFVPTWSGHFGKWHSGTSGAATDTDPTPDWQSLAESGQGEPVAVPTTANPIRHGFDAFAGTLDGIVTSYWSWLEVSAVGHGETPGPARSYVWLEDTYATTETTNQALEWIAAQDAPWFATVAYHAGHQDTSGWGPAHAVQGCSTIEAATSKLQGYRATVECLDSSLYELLTGIDPGVLDQTVILFTGDNGSPAEVAESVYAQTDPDCEDGHCPRGKGTSYETGIRVPFLIADGRSWASLDSSGQPTEGLVAEPGREVDIPVSTTDLFATIAELRGVLPATGLDSTSLWRVMSDPSADKVHDVLYTETFATGWVDGMAALRAGDSKLVVQAHDGEPPCRSFELYDLATDPLEQHDLATDPDHQDELEERIATLDQLDDGTPPDWLELETCP